MLAAFDYDRPDAKCRTDTGADSDANGPADHAADKGTGSGRASDLDQIALKRTLTYGGSFVVHLLDIVTLDGHDFRELGTEVAPAIIVEDYAVKGEQHFAPSLDAAGLHYLAHAALYHSSCDLRRGDDPSGEFLAFAALFGIEVFLKFKDQFGVSRNYDDRVWIALIRRLSGLRCLGLGVGLVDLDRIWRGGFGLGLLGAGDHPLAY